MRLSTFYQALLNHIYILKERVNTHIYILVYSHTIYTFNNNLLK